MRRNSLVGRLKGGFQQTLRGSLSWVADKFQRSSDADDEHRRASQAFLSDLTVRSARLSPKRLGFLGSSYSLKRFFSTLHSLSVNHFISFHSLFAAIVVLPNRQDVLRSPRRWMEALVSVGSIDKSASYYGRQVLSELSEICRLWRCHCWVWKNRNWTQD